MRKSTLFQRREFWACILASVIFVDSGSGQTLRLASGMKSCFATSTYGTQLQSLSTVETDQSESVTAPVGATGTVTILAQYGDQHQEAYTLSCRFLFHQPVNHDAVFQHSCPAPFMTTPFSGEVQFSSAPHGFRISGIGLADQHVAWNVCISLDVVYGPLIFAS